MAGKKGGATGRGKARGMGFRGAEYNPRRISAQALEGLGESLRVFGDLSGMVLNSRTERVVCGHQRKDALHDIDFGMLNWGKSYEVELGAPAKRFTSSEREALWCNPSGGARFRIRLVDWPETFEKAANLAANSPALQGEFTAEAQALLDELRADAPDLSDRLLLDQLRREAPPAAKPAADSEPPGERMTWVSIGIPTVHFAGIAETVEKLAGLNGAVCQISVNGVPPVIKTGRR